MMEISTGGKVCIAVGFFVMFMGLFVSMNTLVGLFLIFGGILTMIQGGKMKVGEPNIKYINTATKEPEGKTYTLGNKKDTNGSLSSINRKGKGAV